MQFAEMSRRAEADVEEYVELEVTSGGEPLAVEMDDIYYKTIDALIEEHGRPADLPKGYKR